MLAALTTLRILVETDEGPRLNPDQFATAWALLRENRGDFLVAPADRAAPDRGRRAAATGSAGWS